MHSCALVQHCIVGKWDQGAYSQACVVGRQLCGQERLLLRECSMWLMMKAVLARRVRAWDAYPEGLTREVLGPWLLWEGAPASSLSLHSPMSTELIS